MFWDVEFDGLVPKVRDGPPLIGFATLVIPALQAKTRVRGSAHGMGFLLLNGT